MVSSPNADRPGSRMDTLAFSRTDGDRLFLQWDCENLAGLASRRTHANVVGRLHRFSHRRPVSKGGMGRLSGELWGALARSAYRAAPSLAPDSGRRFLPRPRLSSG